jgi:hypothetical protein
MFFHKAFFAQLYQEEVFDPTGDFDTVFAA